jgi:hypothetical protein
MAIDFENLCKRIEELHKEAIEFMRNAPFVTDFSKINGKDVDKRCETCSHYNNSACACINWCWMKFNGTMGTPIYEPMKKEDGKNCPDWEEKPKEKKRVWACLNCGKDIYYGDSTELYHPKKYFHHETSDVRCIRKPTLDSDSNNTAIPKPDSERWI